MLRRRSRRRPCRFWFRRSVSLSQPAGRRGPDQLASLSDEARTRRRSMFSCTRARSLRALSTDQERRVAQVMSEWWEILRGIAVNAGNANADGRAGCTSDFSHAGEVFQELMP